MAGRLFKRESKEARARREAFSISMGDDKKRRDGGEGSDSGRGGGEVERLNALKEKEVLEKGATAKPPPPPDAYSREADSLRRAVRERESWEEEGPKLIKFPPPPSQRPIWNNLGPSSSQPSPPYPEFK